MYSKGRETHYCTFRGMNLSAAGECAEAPSCHGRTHWPRRDDAMYQAKQRNGRGAIMRCPREWQMQWRRRLVMKGLRGVLNHYVGGFFVERLVRLQIQRLRYIDRAVSCDVPCVVRCSGAGGSVMKGLRELLNYCIGGLFVERFVRLKIQRLRSVDGFLHAASATIEWGCGGSAGTTECVMRGGAAVVWMRGQRCKTE